MKLQMTLAKILLPGQAFDRFKFRMETVTLLQSLSHLSFMTDDSQAN
jgi:hypothetical protein